MSSLFIVYVLWINDFRDQLLLGHITAGQHTRCNVRYVCTTCETGFLVEWMKNIVQYRKEVCLNETYHCLLCLIQHRSCRLSTFSHLAHSRRRCCNPCVPVWYLNYCCVAVCFRHPSCCRMGSSRALDPLYRHYLWQFFFFRNNWKVEVRIQRNLKSVAFVAFIVARWWIFYTYKNTYLLRRVALVCWMLHRPRNWDWLAVVSAPSTMSCPVCVWKLVPISMASGWPRSMVDHRLSLFRPSFHLQNMPSTKLIIELAPCSSAYTSCGLWQGGWPPIPPILSIHLSIARQYNKHTHLVESTVHNSLYCIVILCVVWIWQCPPVRMFFDRTRMSVYPVFVPVLLHQNQLQEEKQKRKKKQNINHGWMIRSTVTATTNTMHTMCFGWQEIDLIM